MKKLTYSDWQSIEYFREKYGDLRNWIGFESRKEEIKNINPRLIELNDDIIKAKQDLDYKLSSFRIELENTPMEDD